MAYDNYFPPYIRVAEKRARAEKMLDRMKKKNPDMEPVIIEKEIASNWWGRAWNMNLERYADYRNRLGRGRSYVRHKAVLDLKITPGEIRAMVLGSERTPYTINIKIHPLQKTVWQEVKKQCEGKIESLSALLEGRFIKELIDVFFEKGKGLFPSPRQISFKCSCPDFASLCKHTAATLYGTGVRLDSQPSLFFTLRNIDMNELIVRTVKAKTEKLLKKTGQKSGRIMKDANLKEIFGIEIE